MRRLFSLACASVAALVAVSLVILATGDREALIPPPDAVAESFFRQLAANRFERALPYLAESPARRTSAGDLREYWRTVQRGLGGIAQIGAETDWSSEERAEATARIESGGVSRRIRVGLTFEDRLWRIDRLEGFPRA